MTLAVAMDDSRLMAADKPQAPRDVQRSGHRQLRHRLLPGALHGNGIQIVEDAQQVVAQQSTMAESF